jgi:glycosyltransferase involved in cell wall biosynthesis
MRWRHHALGHEAAMRILMCSFDAPEPRTNGIRLAVGALLDELRKSHQIRHIAYRQPDQVALNGDRELRLVELPKRPIRGVTLVRATLRHRPWEADRLAAGIEAPLKQELKAFRPDVVHVNRWILARLGRAITGVPSVLSAFDAWHLNIDASVATANRLKKPFLRAEAVRVRRFEAEEFGRFERVVVVSEEDRAELERLNDDLRISVIPNGVDTSFFSGNAASSLPNRIVFTGSMSYPPNIVAATFLARDLLPRVHRLRPDAELVIVGRDPHPKVVALKALDGVEVTGEVEDVRPWLQSARVFACPMLSGTGIKNKLLEAMASGLPCVVTPLSLQGLDVTVGRDVLVGQSPEDLAELLLRVLDDDAGARQLGSAARDYVDRNHSWKCVARAYEDIYYAVQETIRGGDGLPPP